MTRINFSTVTIALLSCLLVACAPRGAVSRLQVAGDSPGANKLRIASLAPSCTEILCSLGLASQIVAIDTWSVPVEGLPSGLPSFDMLRPDMERLAILEPNIVLVSAMTRAGSSAEPFAPLASSGVRVVYLPTSESIAGIKADVALIAELTGRKEAGAELVASMENEIKRIAAIVRTIPADRRRSVYFELSPAPDLYSFGRDTYLDELISLAGAHNILNTEKGWIAVSAETVATRDPDVILTNVDWIADPAAEIASRAGWAGISAIRESYVYRVDSRTTSRPAPLSAQRALAEIAEAVYPEYFKK